MHIGSQILQIKPFKNSFKKIENFCKKLEKKQYQNQKYDLGGVSVNYTTQKNRDITKEYTNLVRDISLRTKKKIIIEPGRFIVANAGILVTKILYEKYSDKKLLLLLMRV